MAKKDYTVKGSAIQTGVIGTRIDISKVTVARLVTLPTWKWTDGETKFFRVESAIREGRSIDKKLLKEAGAKVEKVEKGEKPKMQPARIMTVTDLQSGNRCDMVVGEVLESNLVENYPNNGYVEKSFQVTRTAVEGKRYKNYSLIEIDISKAEIE